MKYAPPGNSVTPKVKTAVSGDVMGDVHEKGQALSTDPSAIVATNTTTGPMKRAAFHVAISVADMRRFPNSTSAPPADQTGDRDGR